MARVKMILTNGFDPDMRVYKEARYLVNLGHEVEILCWDRSCLYESEVLDGITLTRFHIPSVPGSGFKQLPAFRRFIAACKEKLENESFDYLHCHDFDGILIGRKIKRKNAKLIFDMHELYDSGRLQKFAPLVRRMVTRCQNDCDHVIYLYEEQKTYMTEENKKKLVFLPNYPSEESFSTAKTPSEKLRVAYIGYIRRYDLMKNLFDACAGMDDVQVLIHGSGMDFDRLKALAEGYPNVEMTGRFDGRQIRGLYENADVQYVVYDVGNKNWKTVFPVKLFESIITATPVIAAKDSFTGDFTERNGMGLCVTWDSVEEIRAAVRRFSEEAGLLAEKKKNIEKIRTNYLWETVVENLKMIYQR